MTDILRELETYGAKSRLEAAQHRAQAKELRAEDFTGRHIGPGTEEWMKYHRDQNETEAGQLEARAKAKDERAKVANRGLMLCRDPDELRDMEWTTTHGRLFSAALEAGLVTETAG